MYGQTVLMHDFYIVCCWFFKQRTMHSMSTSWRVHLAIMMQCSENQSAPVSTHDCLIVGSLFAVFGSNKITVTIRPSPPVW